MIVLNANSHGGSVLKTSKMFPVALKEACARRILDAGPEH